VLSEADAAAMVIANTTAYLLKVQVDEIDISRIQTDQPVAVTLDAFPDEELAGKVTDISPSPNKNDSSGIVTFEVVITLGGQNLGLLPGMTATAAIETDRLEEAVVIPNQAIQIDRGEDRSTVFVEKLDENGEPVRVEIELGLRNGPVTHVKSGLASGDQLVIRTEPELPGSPGL
jgi:multidrug efflux pump subunit AcrA (membrane-fusion protein)